MNYNKFTFSTLLRFDKLFTTPKNLTLCGLALTGLIAFNSGAHAQETEPAGNRVLTGAFVDRDWSDSNPCGDKVTAHWEWNDNAQWYGDVRPYFGKIFPEIFKPDGSKNWYGNWQSEIAKIKEQGRVPYINLEFHGELERGDNNECWHLSGVNNGNNRVTHNIIAEILSGQHNDIIDNVAHGLKAEKVPVVIDLFHEANGGWYDWSPCKHPGETWARFRDAYRHVVDRFRAVGATNVEFAQSVWPYSGCWTDSGQWGAGANVDDMYVPGYMQWIGIDIYGRGDFGVFADLMDLWYHDLAATGLPIVIGEMAVGPGPNKASWMRSFVDSLVNGKYPAIKAFNWFDINKPTEVDWRISEGGNGPYFNDLMSNPIFAGGFGTYEIKSKANGECIDVTGASLDNSVKLQTYPCNGSEAQTFTLTDLSHYDMELRAVHSGKCVDVAGGNSADGALVQQYQCNASGAQVWKMNVITTSPLEVEFVAAHSNKCLDVDSVGPKVQQWWCTSGVAQRFYLTKRP
ncbi:RICIN domain-containing protein [Paraglaciecola sp.]|uniref:RICIN domain-containing protein n=1 Tax=Paraglaciecola sp. TaxID=1920173 RepID=UPI0030F39470